MSEISSGLVAVAWIAPDEDRFRVRICEDRPTDAPLWSPMCWVSDAEAIISAKDASIQRLAAQLELNNPALEEAANTIDQQAEQINELESEILEQCRLNGMGAERELALLGQIERQLVKAEENEAIIAAANALENIASTSSSTRIRRVANEALTAIRARRK